MPDLDERLASLGELIDAWLRDAVAHAVSPPAARFGAIIEYHFGWRDTDLAPLAVPAPAGKRLRPALALLVCEAVGGAVEPARDVAVAVELIHNFSLVHDDIQDRSALRRHRRTVWSIWGMPQGINAGDALFALAQLSVLREATPLAARLAAELNATALRLAEGQFLDIALQRGETPATLEAYEAMIGRKTGALFACACRLGAMAAGAPPAAQDAYAAYGLELGLAFQEQDDLLGVWGQADQTGKPQAADVVERKRGLPAALALSEADAPDWLRAAYVTPAAHSDADARAVEDDGMPPELVERVIAHYDRLGLRGRVERRVEARYSQALEHLEAAGPRPPAASYLAALCEALVSRRA